MSRSYQVTKGRREREPFSSLFRLLLVIYNFIWMVDCHREKYHEVIRSPSLLKVSAHRIEKDIYNIKRVFI